MARKRGGEGNISGYFRQVFEEQPDLLKTKSNDAILAKYREDHGLAPDAELDKSIKNGLANVKSVLRKKKRLRGRRKEAAAIAAGETPRAAVRSGTKMESLEEAIDDCLTLARTLDREGLATVIKHLRAARNEVVWRMGS